MSASVIVFVTEALSPTLIFMAGSVVTEFEILCAPSVSVLPNVYNHRDTEDSETARRKTEIRSLRTVPCFPKPIRSPALKGSPEGSAKRRAFGRQRRRLPQSRR